MYDNYFAEVCRKIPKEYFFDGFDLGSKEIIENNFNDKKEIKANI